MQMALPSQANLEGWVKGAESVAEELPAADDCDLSGHKAVPQMASSALSTVSLQSKRRQIPFAEDFFFALLQAGPAAFQSRDPS